MIFLWARVSPAESSNLGHICVQLEDPAASIKWMYNCLYYSSLKISGNEQVFFVENLAPCVHCVAMAHQFQPHTGQIPLASSSHSTQTVENIPRNSFTSYNKNFCTCIFRQHQSSLNKTTDCHVSLVLV